VYPTAVSVTLKTIVLEVDKIPTGIVAITQPFLKHNPSGEGGTPSLPLHVVTAVPLMTIVASSSALKVMVKKPAPGANQAEGRVKFLV
jgi:hypothetical protein